MRVLLLAITVASAIAMCSVSTYARGLQTYTSVPDGFQSYEVQRGDTWKNLTSSEKDKWLAMRINRMNINPRPGTHVLLPVSISAHYYVPVPKQITSSGRHLVIYLSGQYFGAYENGHLIHWGPVSTGKRGRRTPEGNYTAKLKLRRHWSTIYGSRMHYAIQFKGNYFTHEQLLPGYPASSGCVRMMWGDAEWKFGWLQSGDRVSVVGSNQVALQ